MVFAVLVDLTVNRAAICSYPFPSNCTVHTNSSAADVSAVAVVAIEVAVHWSAKSCPLVAACEPTIHASEQSSSISPFSAMPHICVVQVSSAAVPESLKITPFVSGDSFIASSAHVDHQSAFVLAVTAGSATWAVAPDVASVCHCFCVVKRYPMSIPFYLLVLFCSLARR